MKRFQKALLGVVVSGALLFSAQAAELSSSAQDTLQSAMTKVQQEIKDYGQLKTLGFTGENCEIILSNLNAKQYLVNLTADSTHTSMVFWINRPASWSFRWSTIIIFRLAARKHWLASTIRIITPATGSPMKPAS